MDPVIARQTWRTVEPVHGLVYLAREAAHGYQALGLEGASGYFASRAAAMGAVSAEVVIATFFNFHPGFVRTSMDGVWARTTPEAVLATRLEVIDTALRRIVPEIVDAPEVAEAAELAREAAHAAAGHAAGRPLYAAHAALPWPDEPHLALWHAQSVLRELRGDGHVALLTAAGLTGCEALHVHAATGDVPLAALRLTRMWPDDEWEAAGESLRARGWLDAGGRFTDAGRAHRDEVERQTDVLALPAYEALGEEGCARLRALVRPFSQAIASSGELGPMSQARAGG
jgi:hypothetical protein